MSTLCDIDETKAESLFDVVIKRKNGTREGLLMVGEHPVFVVLTQDLTREEAEEIVGMARMLVEPVNTLPI